MSLCWLVGAVKAANLCTASFGIFMGNHTRTSKCQGGYGQLEMHQKHLKYRCRGIKLIKLSYVVSCVDLYATIFPGLQWFVNLTMFTLFFMCYLQ